MTHQTHRSPPTTKPQRFNNSVKVSYPTPTPSFQISTAKSPAKETVWTAATSKICQEGSPPTDIYYSTKGLPAQTAIGHLSSPRAITRPVSMKRHRTAKLRQETSPSLRQPTQTSQSKQNSNHHHASNQHRVPRIFESHQRQLETARSEAKECRSEVQRLRSEVRELRTQRNDLLQLCDRIRKQQMEDREHIREYEQQMALQAVNYRKRIRNLQYELQESCSVEKRLYHLHCYQQHDYEMYSPMLTANRIEETAMEKESSSLVAVSAFRAQQSDTKCSKPAACESLQAADKKEESTISELSLESQPSS